MCNLIKAQILALLRMRSTSKTDLYVYFLLDSPAVKIRRY